MSTVKFTLVQKLAVSLLAMIAAAAAIAPARAQTSTDAVKPTPETAQTSPAPDAEMPSADDLTPESEAAPLPEAAPTEPGESLETPEAGLEDPTLEEDPALEEPTAPSVTDPMEPEPMGDSPEVMPPMEPGEAVQEPIDTSALTVVEVAGSSDAFETLSAAIAAADLTEVLSGEGPFTVFAPTDEAFAALPEGMLEALLLPENKAILTQILTYHVVPDAVVSTTAESGEVITVEGSPITLSVDETGIMVNEAAVLLADVEASNGIVHVIDRVIIPPELLAELTPVPAAEEVLDEISVPAAPEGI